MQQPILGLYTAPRPLVPMDRLRNGAPEEPTGPAATDQRPGRFYV